MYFDITFVFMGTDKKMIPFRPKSGLYIKLHRVYEARVRMLQEKGGPSRKYTFNRFMEDIVVSFLEETDLGRELSDIVFEESYRQTMEYEKNLKNNVIDEDVW